MKSVKGRNLKKRGLAERNIGQVKHFVCEAMVRLPDMKEKWILRKNRVPEEVKVGSFNAKSYCLWDTLQQK